MDPIFLIARSEAVRWIHYLPVATTLLSIAFVGALLRRYRERRSGPHLLWWATGVTCYGAGTALESAITLWGNSITLTRLWYVFGAVLGAYPLSQGTVYLLCRRSLAQRLTLLTIPLALVLIVLVLLSPARLELLEDHRPSGAVLSWSWVRALTPILNLYAVVFLVGGALVSSWRFAKKRETAGPALGNGLIAVGAILPAIGGTLAKAGAVEALYVAELIGLVLIGSGYGCCVGAADRAVPA
jgi:hypothetical protein